MATTPWLKTADQSGLYKFSTEGKYVDRDIHLDIPAADIEVDGSTVSGTVNPNVSVSIGTKASGKYPISGSTTISGTTSGTATATVNTKGFTDEDSYGATVTGTISGTATASGSINAIGLGITDPKNINGTINSVSIGTKSGSTYPVTGSAATSGTVTAKVTSTGYGVANVETGSGSVGGTASVNATIPAASLSVTGSATVTPNGVTAANGNAKVVSTSTSTTAPTDGSYYVGVTPSTAASTTITQTKGTLTAGYLGAASEITASGSVTGGNGSKYYVKIQKGTIGTATTDPGTSYTENTSAAVSSGGYLKIDEGYYPATKISLGTLIGDDIASVTSTTASSSMLSGFRAYDKDGNVLVGNIASKAAGDLSASGKTVTVPAGYYSSQVTKDVASGSYTLATTGTAKVTPTIAYAAGSTTAGSTQINTSTTTVSKTAPSSGYYVAVGTAESTSEITPTATITSGYIANGTAATSTSKATVGANASGTYYIPVTQSTSKVGTTSIASGGTISAGSTLTISAGYYSSDRTFKAQSAADAAPGSYSASGLATGVTTSTSATSYYITPKATIDTAGYLGTGTKTGDKIYLATTSLTNTVSCTAISSTSYTKPTLLTTAPSDKPYITVQGKGTGTAGKVLTSSGTAASAYMEVYNGEYTIA